MLESLRYACCIKMEDCTNINMVSTFYDQYLSSADDLNITNNPIQQMTKVRPIPIFVCDGLHYLLSEAFSTFSSGDVWKPRINASAVLNEWISHGLIK